MPPLHGTSLTCGATSVSRTRSPYSLTRHTRNRFFPEDEGVVAPNARVYVSTDSERYF